MADTKQKPAADQAAITLIEAITQAMAWEMRHDDSVLVLGEDVGVNGGVFRATAGLQAEFGDERVLDTPLTRPPSPASPWASPRRA
jgi:2-oxoisovalerate dehydrogenase E1 component beta subunit